MTKLASLDKCIWYGNLRLDFLTQFDTQKFQTIEKNPIKEFTEVKILKVHSPKDI